MLGITTEHEPVSSAKAHLMFEQEATENSGDRDGATALLRLGRHEFATLGIVSPLDSDHAALEKSTSSHRNP